MAKYFIRNRSNLGDTVHFCKTNERYPTQYGFKVTGSKVTLLTLIRERKSHAILVSASLISSPAIYGGWYLTQCLRALRPK